MQKKSKEEKQKTQTERQAGKSKRVELLIYTSFHMSFLKRNLEVLMQLSKDDFPM